MGVCIFWFYDLWWWGRLIEEEVGVGLLLEIELVVWFSNLENRLVDVDFRRLYLWWWMMKLLVEKDGKKKLKM